MAFSIQDTIIIIGDSPFLSEVENTIHYINQKYTTIGINRVIRKINTTYHIFVDEKILPYRNPSIPIITLALYGDLITNKEVLINTFSYKFDEDKRIFKDNKLAWCGFTHDYAISYCIWKGYKNIILIGAADFIEGKHYSNNETFSYSEILEKNSKKFIEEVCSNYVNIYTCNPNSKLNIPYIPIQKVLDN